jgi:hypothetical protein
MLSEGAQAFVNNHGGWWHFVQMMELDPSVLENVEVARKYAEDVAIGDYPRGRACAGR